MTAALSRRNLICHRWLGLLRRRGAITAKLHRPGITQFLMKLLSLTRAANPTASAFFYRVVRGRWVVAPPP